MTVKIEADFKKMKKEVNEILSKQDEFDRLDYFVEIRKLYSLLQALIKGGTMVSNSNVMAKMPPELLKNHFNRLVQLVFEICDMAVQMKSTIEDIKPKRESEEEEESEEEIPEKESYEFEEQEISYVV